MNKKNFIISLISLAIIVVIGYLTWYLVQDSKFNSGNNLVYRETIVQRDSVINEVKATGIVQPASDVNLAFERSGKITAVKVRVGDVVSAGQILATLDSADLVVSAAQARANLLAAQAQLEQLKNGTRPEEIAIAQNTLQQNKENLKSIYDSALVIITDAYAKSDDAIRNSTDSMFINPNSDSPRLNFLNSNSSLENAFVFQRQIINNDLKVWQSELEQLKSSSDPIAIETEISKIEQYLNDVRTYLSQASDMVTASINLPSATVNTYRTSLNLSRNSITGVTNAINSIKQNLTNQKIAIDQSQKQLDLKLAGARSEDIAAQTARVTQAQAALDAINLQMSKSALRAPFNGTVVKVDAKVGAIATAGLPVIYLISNNKFEVETRVSEDVVAKLKTGDDASITLDALREDKVFPSKIISIDPTPTSNTKGETGYRLRLQFIDDDPNIKNGMTANIKIVIDNKSNVLCLPKEAIIRKNLDYYVINEEKQQQQIQVGLIGSDGKVEVVSGLKEGDKVLILGQ